MVGRVGQTEHPTGNDKGPDYQDGRGWLALLHDGTQPDLVPAGMIEAGPET